MVSFTHIVQPKRERTIKDSNSRSVRPLSSWRAPMLMLTPPCPTTTQRGVGPPSTETEVSSMALCGTALLAVSRCYDLKCSVNICCHSSCLLICRNVWFQLPAHQLHGDHGGAGLWQISPRGRALPWVEAEQGGSAQFPGVCKSLTDCSGTFFYIKQKCMSEKYLPSSVLCFYTSIGTA